MSSRIKVLFGDSTPSNLEADILDVVVRLVECAREVANGYLDVTNLETQSEEASEVTDVILADLDLFQRQVEVGLRATAAESTRPELGQHGEEAIETVVRMVDGWRHRYLESLEAEHGRISKRRDETLSGMRGSMERFVLPMRDRAPERIVNRVFEGGAYHDEITAELVPGVGLRLQARDSEPETPRRLKTLLGKGARIQIGTKLSMLRKIEEPLWFSFDDQVIIEAKIEPDRARVVLAKKPGSSTTLTVELAAVGDGATARVTRPDGERAMLPETDAQVVQALWQALQVEVARIVASPARLVTTSLDDTEAVEATTMLEVVERIVEFHRPLVAAIAERSPNVEELAIKIETDDGKREEAWVRRDELTQHLLGLPAELGKRLSIAGVEQNARLTGARLPPPGAIRKRHAGASSERITLDPPPPQPPPRRAPTPDPGAPVKDVTEDISLRDLDLLIETTEGEDDVYAGPTRVRTRGST